MASHILLPNSRQVSKAVEYHFVTSMTVQSLRFIEENPGVVLMIENGYKYYFYGESAMVRLLGVDFQCVYLSLLQIASKELGIVAYLRRNLMTASIPVHRRDVHLKK